MFLEWGFHQILVKNEVDSLSLAGGNGRSVFIFILMDILNSPLIYLSNTHFINQKNGVVNI